MASAARLAAGLAQRGLGGIVFSPGSRNAPLIQAFSPLGLPSAVALDERSAAHHALGMAQALGQPVAVSCTSGTASLHHGPALAEAHRVGLPLVSLTADRPAGAHDEWQSQTMVQAGIHATHVRADFIWDCPSDAAAVGLLDDMASAWAHGPIHVNCPFDTPLYPDAAHPQAASGTPETAAPLASRPADNGDATVLIERLGQAIQKSERILLLGGTQPAPLNPIDLRAWAKCAVLAGDSTSGMALDGLPVITACDRWLAAWEASGKPWEDARPDLIVTFGAPLLSRKLRAALAQGGPDHFHIDAGGGAPQAFGDHGHNVPCNLSHALSAGAARFAASTGDMAAETAAWTRAWWETETRLRDNHAATWSGAPWSDLQAHGILHAAHPADWRLHLGNSTPVRYAQLFAGRSEGHPWSNRGVAGIDGCTSTALGSALAGFPTTLITGELGFLYDANAFHIHPLPSNLRVAVIHNGGGGIFRWLDGPERTGLAASHFEWQHGTELRPLCDLHGLIHEQVQDAEGLKAALRDWWAPSDAPKVLEVTTPGGESAAAYLRYMQAVQR